MTELPAAADPMRERILQATFKVLCRHGYGKFNLSDVATQAGISRPTLYKWFSSKDELLSAFGEFELQLVRDQLAQAIEGLRGRARFGAVLQFLADFYSSYQMRGLIEIEPGLALEQMAAALPRLNDLIAPELTGQVSDPNTVAMTLIRLSVCHYLVPGVDEHQLIDQLRAAAGLG